MAKTIGVAANLRSSEIIDLIASHHRKLTQSSSRKDSSESEPMAFKSML